MAHRRHNYLHLVYGRAFGLCAISARDLRVAMNHERRAVARVGVSP